MRQIGQYFVQTILKQQGTECGDELFEIICDCGLMQRLAKLSKQDEAFVHGCFLYIMKDKRSREFIRQRYGDIAIDLMKDNNTVGE